MKTTVRRLVAALLGAALLAAAAIAWSAHQEGPERIRPVVWDEDPRQDEAEIRDWIRGDGSPGPELLERYPAPAADGSYLLSEEERRRATEDDEEQRRQNGR